MRVREYCAVVWAGILRGGRKVGRKVGRGGLTARALSGVWSGVWSGVLLGVWLGVWHNNIRLCQNFLYSKAKCSFINRFQQGMRITGVSQGVPLAVVRRNGQSFAKRQPSLGSLVFKAFKQAIFRRTAHRRMHHKQQGGIFSIQFQSFAQGTGFSARQAHSRHNMGKALAFNGLFSHNGHMGVQFFVSTRVMLQRFETQGKRNACSLRGTFHIQVTVVGSGQFPCPRQGKGGTVARRNARSCICHRKKQMSGIGAFRYTPHRKVHSPARSGPNGTFQQKGEGFAQGMGLPLIHMAQQGGHIPSKAYARIFGSSADTIVRFTHHILQVEGAAGFAYAALVKALAGIVQRMGHVGGGLKHVLGILPHSRGQGAMAKGRAFAQQPFQWRTQRTFPQAVICPCQRIFRLARSLARNLGRGLGRILRPGRGISQNCSPRGVGVSPVQAARPGSIRPETVQSRCRR